MRSTTSTTSSYESYTITDSELSEIDLNNYSEDFIKKAVSAYERKLEMNKIYQLKKQSAMTEEQLEEKKKKQREYSKKYCQKIKDDPEFKQKRKERAAMYKQMKQSN